MTPFAYRRSATKCGAIRFRFLELARPRAPIVEAFKIAPGKHAHATAVPADRILADRAEFVESLQRLRRGHVLVRTGDDACGCVLDGAIVYRSYPPLVRYGLIDEFENPEGFPGVQYFRITPRGREFAQRAWEQWRSRSVWERLAVRLVG